MDFLTQIVGVWNITETWSCVQRLNLCIKNWLQAHWGVISALIYDTCAVKLFSTEMLFECYVMLPLQQGWAIFFLSRTISISRTSFQEHAELLNTYITLISAPELILLGDASDIRWYLLWWRYSQLVSQVWVGLFWTELGRFWKELLPHRDSSGWGVQCVDVEQREVGVALSSSLLCSSMHQLVPH